MTLRARFLAYLVVLHLVFAGCAVWFLRGHPVWLIALEIFFAISLTLGIGLQRAYFGPLALVRSGAHYIREGEFTTRFVPTGHPDMDQLIDVFNRMVDSLRQQRICNEEQGHLLQKVLDESPGGVITMDMDGRVSTINPAAESLLGCEAASLIGRPLTDLGTTFADQLVRLARDESRLLTLQGQRRVRCQAAEFLDRGFPRRFLLLDELTRELHRTEKTAYGKLIRLMSHEVNNTIGAVQSLLQSCLAFRRQLDDPDRAEFSRALEVAISRTANLGEFTSRFAEVVRLPGPRHRPADPWKIASQVGRLFRDRCEAAGVAWREEVPGGLPPVHCDPVQLEQVLVNVVKNAVEAMEEAPVSAGDRGGRDRPREIVLRGGRQGRRPFLAIRDTGPGLTEETAARLFTPFFTTREKGQGIGLTMVQEILLAHGFDFSLQNGDCQGAEFTIVF